MSTSFQTRRLNELLLDLVCALDPDHSHESLPRAVKQYAAALSNHKYLTVMDRDVDKAFEGICEKVATSSRLKESNILRLSKDKFIQRHAYAKEKCYSSDITDGSGTDIPHCMLRLLLSLANAPTAPGKFVSMEELMDAERDLTRPILPISANEEEEEKERSGGPDVLRYSEWRAQCAEEDSADEEDEGWLMEDEQAGDNIAPVKSLGKIPAVEQADTDSEKESTADLSEQHNNYEFLLYGAHISCCEGTIDTGLNGKELNDQRGDWDGCTCLKYLNRQHNQALVLDNSEVCRMVLQTLGGFQNDLFLLNTETVANKVDFKGHGGSDIIWIKSPAASRATLSGMSIQSTQQLFQWFLDAADEIHICRRVSKAVMDIAALPLSDRRFKSLSPTSSTPIFIDQWGGVVDGHFQAAAVFTSALTSLYAAIYNEVGSFAACLSELEARVALADTNTLHTPPTLLSLYLTMMHWRRLFAVAKAVMLSTKSIYVHCMSKIESMQDSLPYVETAEIDSQSGHEFALERAVLSSLISCLMNYINEGWFGSIRTTITSSLAPADKYSHDDNASIGGSQAHEYCSKHDSDSDSDDFMKQYDPDSLRLKLDDISTLNCNGRSRDIAYAFTVILLKSLLGTELSVMVAAHTETVDNKLVSVSAKTSLTEFIYDANLQKLWGISRQSKKEFELVSRIPGVLGTSRAGRDLRGDTGAVSGIFKEIAGLVCDSISEVFAGGIQKGSCKSGEMREHPKIELESLDYLPAPRHELFQNTSADLSCLLQQPRNLLSSGGGKYKDAQSKICSTNSIVDTWVGGYSIFSCASYMRLAVVRPLLLAIRKTASEAAASMVRVPRPLPVGSLPQSPSFSGEGFKLMHHLEYIRMLFLLGGESLRIPETDCINEWLHSPGTIFVPLQETYCSMLETVVLKQHNSIDVLGKQPSMALTTEGISFATNAEKGSLFMRFSQELYSLGQMMLTQLINGLPIQHEAQMGVGSDALSKTGSVGVAVSFRSSPIGNDSESQEPKSIWPSAAVADLICKHLAIEVYYPFPLNRILTPSLIKRLHGVMVNLLKLTTMRWGIEATWKLDKVSKAALQNILIGYRSAEEVASLRQRLDKCRVSLSWLMHTMKGLLYYIMSEVHDTAWAKLAQDMRIASQYSMEAQLKIVEGYVCRVEGLLALYGNYISNIISKGHAAISAYQLSLYAIRDVCDCAKEDQKRGAHDNISTLDSSRTRVVVAKCVAAVKRSDLEFTTLRVSLRAFLDVLHSLAGDFSRGGTDGRRHMTAGMATVVNAADRMAFGGSAHSSSEGGRGWSYSQREAARVLSINETTRLYAILGGTWLSD